MLKRVLRGLALSAALWPLAGIASDGPVHWQGWSEDLFARAKAEHRLVLLDMEAVWCHWCHVMDEKTYANAEVAAAIGERYIAVKVDQDSHPALSARYEDWGWPATVVFDADGNELWKGRGFVEPQQMLATLKEIIANPSPLAGRSAESQPVSGGLPEAERARMHERFRTAWDDELVGWGRGSRFLQVEPLDYALLQARRGDKESGERAKRLLDQTVQLIDPVWGGMFQYSEPGSWQKPHYEKIMSIQAGALRLYAQAYAAWGDPRHLAAAQKMRGFLLEHFRSPDGAFFTSQDADARTADGVLLGKDFYAMDDARRQQAPLPRLDRSAYARENGWAITALAAYHDATGDAEALAAARRAADWVLANRALQQGGFAHGSGDQDGPYLSDSLAMGEAMLALYRSTGERQWLERAGAAARFVIARFQSERGSFIAAPAKPGAVGVLAAPLEHLDDNVMTIRWLNLLGHATGDPAFRAAAERGMAWAVGRPEAGRGAFWPGLLQADRELAEDPVHVAVVGHKDDPQAQALYAAALKYPATYKRAEFWDRRDGPLPNSDIRYPEMAEAAAYGCANKVCSLPSFTAEDFTQSLDHLFARTARAER